MSIVFDNDFSHDEITDKIYQNSISVEFTTK